MKLNNLVKTNEKKIRPGRGIGSGKGKTSGRGIKGQKSRRGVAIKAFEGGQTPLYRRLPKRGFKSFAIKDTAIINLSNLQKFYDAKKLDGATPINLKLLQEKKIINKKYIKLKILGDGELTNKVDITTDRINKEIFSFLTKNAIQEIFSELITISIIEIIRKVFLIKSKSL